MERHRDEGRALVLTGREKHVELALVGGVRDGRGEPEELVGRVAHRRDDDDEIGACGALAGNPPGNTPDPVRVGEAGPPEFLDDERRGRHRDILPPDLHASGSRVGCGARTPLGAHDRVTRRAACSAPRSTPR